MLLRAYALKRGFPHDGFRRGPWQAQNAHLEKSRQT